MHSHPSVVRVTDRLAELGAIVVDADVVAREVTAPGQPAHDAILALFGDRVRAADGTVDRRALARNVFTDPAALADLEAIVAPACLAFDGVTVVEHDHGLDAPFAEAESRLRAGAASLDDALARTRALYRAKCDVMLAALERSMPDGTRWTRPEGGFFSWVTLPEGADAVELAKAAGEHGVGIVPGSLFFPDGRGTDNVRLSFSLVDESSIDEGIARLAALVEC